MIVSLSSEIAMRDLLQYTVNMRIKFGLGFFLAARKAV
jgi:hypothetical protein